MCMHSHAVTCMCRSESSLWGLGLSFHHVGTRNQTQAAPGLAGSLVSHYAILPDSPFSSHLNMYLLSRVSSVRAIFKQQGGIQLSFCCRSDLSASGWNFQSLKRL